MRAHEEGIIHFHDSDYFAQKEHNCDLINLEDMLQNGTVISETLIEKPHSFFTACNVTTQIVAQVASNQYGGQSFTLAHLAPFVDISRQKIRKNVIEERKECGEAMDEEIIAKEMCIRDRVLNAQLWMLYAASIVIGAGLSLVVVVSSSLISDYFTGIEKSRCV